MYSTYDMVDLDIDTTSFTAKKLLLRPTNSQPSSEDTALSSHRKKARRLSSPKSVCLPPLLQKSYGETSSSDHGVATHRSHGELCSCGLPNPKYCMLDLIASVQKFKNGRKRPEFAWVPMSI